MPDKISSPMYVYLTSRVNSNTYNYDGIYADEFYINYSTLHLISDLLSWMIDPTTDFGDFHNLLESFTFDTETIIDICNFIDFVSCTGNIELPFENGELYE